MGIMDLRVIYEDAGLLVANKPADLVCHPTKQGPGSSLVSRARIHLGEQSNPQLVNRLDRETTGLVAIGKGVEAARPLRRAFEEGRVRKEYLAIVRGQPGADEGVIEAPLGKDEQSPVAIKDCVRPDGAAALTAFRVLGRFTSHDGAFSLLRVLPRTGRKHQIRIHLAHAGFPIVGDKLYGGDEWAYLNFVQGHLTPEQSRVLLLANHALHAGRLELPWRGGVLRLGCPPDPSFLGFLPQDLRGLCGGDARAELDLDADGAPPELV